MAHTAQLKLEGREYKIIDCDYVFSQPTKENGQPAGFPAGGLINLTIESPDNSDLFIHRWMQGTTEHKDGTIVFSVVNAGKPSTKTLHFKRAYCIRLHEKFSTGSDAQMLTNITISAAEIAFGRTESLVFKNDRK